MITLKEILNSLAASLIAIMLAAAIVVALDFSFRPGPRQLDPLAPLHLSDKWP